MPAARDLNVTNHASQNPYDDTPHRVSHYTATEIATLAARLEKQLGPEYISTRPGAGGGRVHYLAAEKVINLANEVFGFNGWSSAIQQVQIDFCDESSSQKINLGLSIIVRVTLKDGTYHEDIGYGHIENCKGKAAAFEKAKKEAATDALKRALRNFGNVLGNCLYDKDYLQRVTKIKPDVPRWTVDRLHRHPDYMPIRKEQTNGTSNSNGGNATRMRSDLSAVSLRTLESTGEDEFGDKMFDDTDFTNPDEARPDDSAFDRDSPVENVLQHQQAPRWPMERNQSAPNLQRPGSAHQLPPPQGASRAPELRRPQANGRPGEMNPPGQFARALVPPAADDMAAAAMKRDTTPPIAGVQPQMPPSGDALPGFMTGKSLAKPEAPPLPFNPHAESPSIRRTAGVNSGKSEPILRSVLNGQGTGGGIATSPASETARPGPAQPRTNFVNPAADVNRKVGMPGGSQSPMINRNAYKPPTAVKRPAPVESAIRPPLADTTNVILAENGSDVKKLKVEPGGPPVDNTAKT